MNSARIWKFGDDVDTDQIIASQYLIRPNIDEMKEYAFESLNSDFAANVQNGDIVLAGNNFGCGSSREQAPAVLKALGVQAVIAKSFARIFFRNAINIGLPVIICDSIQDSVEDGDRLFADLEAGLLQVGDKKFSCTKLPPHMQRILEAGGILASLKTESLEKGDKPGNAEPSSVANLPMTMAEKIIARAAGLPCVQAGEIHSIKLDKLMSNDGTTHLTIDMYNKLPNPHLDSPDSMVFIVDHNSPADSPKTAAAHKKMRNFAKENGIHFHEGQGVCHQIMVEKYVNPGEFIIGADSHTCTYGALGAFGTGVGCTDFLFGMVTGTTWVMVPKTLRFKLKGRLRPGVSSRDLMLTIIGDIGADGATYKVMEFVGEGVSSMSLGERLVLSNLAVEAGAKTALMESDEKVIEFLEKQGRKPKLICKSDEAAVFDAEYEYDLDKITQVVARPHRIDDVVPISSLGEVKIDQAFLGSCNAGRIEELRAAAKLLKDRQVHPDVRFIVSPASQAVYLQALEEGILQILNQAGAMVVNPNCSVCWGSCQGLIAAGEVLVSTGTRNFKGRSGSPDSFVYLASAETVTASAIAGHICIADSLN